MKKIVACLAMLTFLSAMTSCGVTETASDSSSTRPTSPSASTSATATENTKSDKTTVAAGTSANNDTDNSNSSENSAVTAGTENNGTPLTKTDFNLIAGKWYEENALDSRTLTIDADGSYELAYRGGGKQCGKIKIEIQDLDGTNSNTWYTFYNGDTKWESFRLKSREGSSPVLCSGFDDTSLVFVLNGENGGETAGNNALSADSFLGTWSVGRCYININSSGGNSYSVDVKWASSAAESRYWTYPCVYDESTGTLVCNGTGSSVNSVFTEDGTETTEQIFTNGSASFAIDNNGYLVWNDYTEPENNGMTLMRI